MQPTAVLSLSAFWAMRLRRLIRLWDQRLEGLSIDTKNAVKRLSM
jgi:hypothetical protein